MPSSATLSTISAQDYCCYVSPAGIDYDIAVEPIMITDYKASYLLIYTHIQTVSNHKLYNGQIYQ